MDRDILSKLAEFLPDYVIREIAQIHWIEWNGIDYFSTTRRNQNIAENEDNNKQNKDDNKQNKDDNKQNKDDNKQNKDENNETKNNIFYFYLFSTWI